MPREIEVKSVLNKQKHRDSWFLDDYTLNLYSSCSYNCLYCYIRGSKYGSNLETSLSIKANAIPVLDRQLAARARKGQHGFIVLSSATDPYLNIEKQLGLTRQALETILRHRFPVHMLTKSTLIERDFDLLHEIDARAILPEALQGRGLGGTIVSFSFSNLDDEVGAIFEPGAPLPTERLQTMRHAVAAGFLTGVSLMPLLPFISDTTAHLDHMFGSFRDCGAHYVLPATLTLFGDGKADSKTLTMNAIRKYYPHLEDRYNRYFAGSNQMPEYYREAFYKKMGELSAAFGISSSILEGATQKAKGAI
jgi:DNA repair photolyase